MLFHSRSVKIATLKIPADFVTSVVTVVTTSVHESYSQNCSSSQKYNRRVVLCLFTEQLLKLMFKLCRRAIWLWQETIKWAKTISTLNGYCRKVIAVNIIIFLILYGSIIFKSKTVMNIDISFINKYKPYLRYVYLGAKLSQHCGTVKYRFFKVAAHHQSIITSCSNLWLKSDESSQDRPTRLKENLQTPNSTARNHIQIRDVRSNNQPLHHSHPKQWRER